MFVRFIHYHSKVWGQQSCVFFCCLFLKERKILLFSKDVLSCTKVTINTFNILQNISIQISSVLLNLIFIRAQLFLPLIIIRMFLEHQISILE